MTPGEETPKLHIDTDWKAEAQAEKERLAAKETEAKAGGGAGGGQQLPDASFKTLVGLLASQALMGLGTMVDPETKGVVVDLDGARFSIDLLTVLEEKTKGNLEEDEATELQQLTAELRARFVQVANLVAQSAAAGGPGATGPAGMRGPGAPPSPDSPGPLVT